MGKTSSRRQMKQALEYLVWVELYYLSLFLVYYFVVKLIIVTKLGQTPFELQLVSFYPLILVILLMLEGSFYWHNILRRLKRKKALSRQQIGQIYEPILWLNWFIMVGYLPVLVLSLPRVSFGTLFIGLGFYLLAFSKFINYFYVRLSYEIETKALSLKKPLVDLIIGQGKKSKLRQDLELHFDKKIMEEEND